MKLTFLGTGGWMPKYRHTACALLETSKANFILDAGTGLSRLGSALNPKKPAFLLISHFHLDHAAGLFYLYKGGAFNGGSLAICVPKGMKKWAKVLLDPPFGVGSGQFKIIELEEGVNRLGGARVVAARLEHGAVDFGYRIEADGKAVAYLTDTAVCSAGERLSRGADAVIHESTYSGREWRAAMELMKHNVGKAVHATSGQAALLAKRAGAKKLFLYHYDYKLPEKGVAGLLAEARAVFKNTFASRDGLSVKV